MIRLLHARIFLTGAFSICVMRFFMSVQFTSSLHFSFTRLAISIAKCRLPHQPRGGVFDLSLSRLFIAFIITSFKSLSLFGFAILRNLTFLLSQCIPRAIFMCFFQLVPALLEFRDVWCEVDCIGRLLESVQTFDIL